MARARSANPPGGRTVRPRPSASWLSGRTRPGRRGPVAGDVAGIAFNAQAVTVAAQIVAVEASWWPAGGPAVVGPTIARAVAWRGSWSRSAALAAVAVAAGPAGMPALWGWAGGRPRTGRRGSDKLQSSSWFAISRSRLIPLR
jgi:hypothetical protein